MDAAFLKSHLSTVRVGVCFPDVISIRWHPFYPEILTGSICWHLILRYLPDSSGDTLSLLSWLLDLSEHLRKNRKKRDQPTSKTVQVHSVNSKHQLGILYFYKHHATFSSPSYNTVCSRIIQILYIVKVLVWGIHSNTHNSKTPFFVFSLGYFFSRPAIQSSPDLKMYKVRI